MAPADYERFVEIVAGFAELKGKDLSPAAIKLYWRAMQHWPIDDFARAAEHLLRTCEFMPTPKNFEDLRRSGRPTAAEAWASVLSHCRGAYRNGDGLDDGGPIDRAVAGLGGYRAIAFYDLAYLGVLEQRFADHYAESSDVAESREALPVIARRLHASEFLPGPDDLDS